MQVSSTSNYWKQKAIEAGHSAHLISAKLVSTVRQNQKPTRMMLSNCAELGSFNKGKDASAYIGLTPIQYSSGGMIKKGNIGKYVKNGLLRSQLITGAMAVVAQVSKRTAVTKKEAWIQALVARRGKKMCGCRVCK